MTEMMFVNSVKLKKKIIKWNKLKSNYKLIDVGRHIKGKYNTSYILELEKDDRYINKWNSRYKIFKHQDKYVELV